VLYLFVLKVPKKDKVSVERLDFGRHFVFFAQVLPIVLSPSFFFLELSTCTWQLYLHAGLPMSIAFAIVVIYLEWNVV